MAGTEDDEKFNYTERIQMDRIAERLGYAYCWACDEYHRKPTCRRSSSELIRILTS